MSGSPLYSIQLSIYNILTLDPQLMSRITGVFDYVPENQAFPYVVIGEFTSGPWETFQRYGEEVIITIHVWSRYSGMKQSEKIMDDLNRLLARKMFFIDGWGNVGTWLSGSSTLIEPDGFTRHGIVRYRLLTLADDEEG